MRQIMMPIINAASRNIATDRGALMLHNWIRRLYHSSFVVRAGVQSDAFYLPPVNAAQLTVVDWALRVSLNLTE